MCLPAPSYVPPIISSLFKADEAYGNAKAQKRFADMNTATAMQDAAIAQQRAAFNERKQRDQTLRQLGLTRARFGKSGVTMEGSPTDVLGDMAALGELDALGVRSAGAIDARAALSRAQVSQFQADQARRAMTMGPLNAILQSPSSWSWLTTLGK